jgi:hypothetical protein
LKRETGRIAGETGIASALPKRFGPSPLRPRAALLNAALLEVRVPKAPSSALIHRIA